MRVEAAIRHRRLQRRRSSADEGRCVSGDGKDLGEHFGRVVQAAVNWESSGWMDGWDSTALWVTAKNDT